MFHVVLYEPEIPSNTGNIGRLCVATGSVLHLVGSTGFRLDNRHLHRAGLDYWGDVQVRRHDDLPSLEALLPPARLFCFSAHAARLYTDERFRPGDAFVFGPESRGLPPEVLARHADRTLLIPIPTGKVRSLNLANAVGIALYEALRQVGTGSSSPPA